MSITLQTPWTVGGAGIAAETDASAALMAVDNVDPVAQTITAVFRIGTATVVSSKTTALTPGAQSPTVTVVFNVAQKSWYASTGAGGTLTAGEVTAVSNLIAGVMTAARNPGESFAISHNIFGPGGVAVVW